MVPLQLLIGMFSDGVNSLKELANQRKAHASDLSDNTGARRVRAMLRMTQKENVVLHISLIKPHTRQLPDACLAVKGQHYYSSCRFPPFFGFEMHCVLLW